MKQFISIIVLILLLFAGKKGYGLYKKYRHAKQLKFFVAGIQLPILQLTDIIQPVTLTIRQAITNFSTSNFTLSALNIDAYTPSGKLVAQQKQPLNQPIQIKPNQTTEIPLQFELSPQTLIQLIRENGGVFTAGSNYLTTGTYGIKLRLKGYVQAEGFDIDIDQTITV